MATPVGAVCPPRTSFYRYGPPLNFTVDSEKYGLTGVPTPLVMNFQWAMRTSAPLFRDSFSGVLLEEPTTTVLRHLNRAYTLVKIQFTPPAHQSWVIPATAQPRVKEEIVLSFRTSDRVNENEPNTIILVVPVVRTESATPPPYLKSLANPNDMTAQISPRELIPVSQNNLYAYYSLCAQGMAQGDMTQHPLVIVFVRGLPLPEALMNSILANLNSANVEPSFGNYEPPDGLVFYSGTGQTIEETSFPEWVKHAYNLLEPLTLQPTTQVIPKEVPTDAFKCVPLNPETDIQDGKVIIDPTTGETLKRVQEEREAVKAEAKSTLTIAAYTEHVKVGLSTLLAIAFVLLLLFIVYSGAGEVGVQGEQVGAFKRFVLYVKDLPLPVVTAVVAGFTGYLIGLFR